MATLWRWATVMGNSPLSIKLDGDTAALPGSPDSLIDPRELIIGDRVRCELTDRRVVVHGRAMSGAERIGAYCWLTSTTAIGTSNTTLSWSAVMDKAGYFSSSTPTIITAPYSGDYMIDYWLRVSGTAAMSSYVEVNGVVDGWLEGSGVGASGGASQAGRSGAVQLQEGDQINVYGIIGTASSGSHSFMIRYLGPS